MANVDKPRGFEPVQYLNGNPWNNKFNIYYVPATDSTAIFVGDAVTHAGSADPLGRYPSVAQAAAGTGNKIVGVAIGFGLQPQIVVDPTDLEAKYRVASTERYVAVVDDPNVIFEIQEVSGGTALTVAAVGLNTPLVVGTGSTLTGMSGMELNNAGEVATTEQLRILRLAPREDNELGEHAKWWVLINEHEFRLQTGS